MKPRFDQRPARATPDALGNGNGAPTTNCDALPQRGAASVKPARGMRSAWLKLQLFVADVRHHNKLRVR